VLPVPHGPAAESFKLRVVHPASVMAWLLSAIAVRGNSTTSVRVTSSADFEAIPVQIDLPTAPTGAENAATAAVLTEELGSGSQVLRPFNQPPTSNHRGRCIPVSVATRRWLPLLTFSRLE